MQTKKLSERFSITHENKEILVEKFEDGKLEILPVSCGWREKGFVFKNSKPNTAKIIGEMLIRASEL